MGLTRKQSIDLARRIQGTPEYVVVVIANPTNLKDIKPTLLEGTQVISRELQVNAQNTKSVTFSITSDEVNRRVYKNTIKEISELLYEWSKWELREYKKVAIKVRR